MNGVRVNSFANLPGTSVVQGKKKDIKQNTPNWKVYATAGTAIAFSALATGWALSRSSNSDPNTENFTDIVNAVFTTNNIPPAYQETAKKVLKTLVTVLGNQGITDQVTTAAVATAKEINPMLARFPTSSPLEIALLSAVEGIRSIFATSALEQTQLNEVTKLVFENSCKELKVNLDELIQKLTNQFKAPTKINVGFFVEAHRVDPCQYPYCEKWASSEPSILYDDFHPGFIPLKNSLNSNMKYRDFSFHYRDAGLAVLSQFNKILDNMDWEEGRRQALEVASAMRYQMDVFLKHFPGATPMQIAILAFLDTFNMIMRALNLSNSEEFNLLTKKLMKENCKNPKAFNDEKGFYNLFNSASTEAKKLVDQMKHEISEQTLYCQNQK